MLIRREPHIIGSSFECHSPVVEKRAMIDSTGNIYIGKNVDCGFNVNIITHYHPCHTVRGGGKGAVGVSLYIEDDVFIGDGVTILPNTRWIGKGAVIGAASVVTKSVEPMTIVAGNPARKIGVVHDNESSEVEG